MLSDRSYLMMTLTMALGGASMEPVQLVLEDVLRNHGYTNNFCGLVLAETFTLSPIFLLIFANLIDKPGSHVMICRLGALITGIGFAMYCLSLNFSNIQILILASNLIVTIGVSLLTPSLIQVTFKATSGILPEASAFALCSTLSQALVTLFIEIQGPLIALAPNSDSKYLLVLGCFGSITFLINTIFAIKFKEPNKQRLMERLEARE